jgi:glycosyltransferase involved in cell wall biosynthesis
LNRNVLIDAYNLALAKGTGIATYARNLSYALRDTGRGVDVLYETPFASGDGAPETSFFDAAMAERTPPSLPKQVYDIAWSLLPQRAVAVQASADHVSEQFRSRLPHFDRIWTLPHLFETSVAKFEVFSRFTRITVPHPPAVAHWTYPLPIRAKGTKNIYTIHDLVPLQFPHLTLDNEKQHHKLLRRLVREADHIVTVSETSRRDICNLFGVAEDRVTNTYQSVEIPRQLAQRSETEIAPEIEKLSGARAKEYFLFYGAIEPKKNVIRLIEAFLLADVKAPLLIAGVTGWLSKEDLRRFDEAIEANPQRIRRIDYVPFAQLVSLIRGAKAVLFPSLYEGFGLPVLESMLLKTPVMASTKGAIPEVAGEAALLADPYDIGAMAAAIRALDADSALRARLSADGFRQASIFSAARYRQRLDALYTRLENRSG